MQAAEAKKHQRSIARQRLSALTQEETAAASESMCGHFIASGVFRDSKIIMAYMAMLQEADPSIIIKSALDNGKEVVIPFIDEESRRIIPVKLKSIREGLVKNRYGIYEPQKIEPVDVRNIDVVIVPGLAFDARGGRLGRGGGFYDKLLVECSSNCIKCGFGLGCQVIDEVETDVHDVLMDRLLTENGFIQF
jgi:5-formyltetrahydrofolate cyclo-ligase